MPPLRFGAGAMDAVAAGFRHDSGLLEALREVQAKRTGKLLEADDVNLEARKRGIPLSCDPELEFADDAMDAVPDRFRNRPELLAALFRMAITPKGRLRRDMRILTAAHVARAARKVDFPVNDKMAPVLAQA